MVNQKVQLLEPLNSQVAENTAGTGPTDTDIQNPFYYSKHLAAHNASVYVHVIYTPAYNRKLNDV